MSSTIDPGGETKIEIKTGRNDLLRQCDINGPFHQFERYRSKSASQYVVGKNFVVFVKHLYARPGRFRAKRVDGAAPHCLGLEAFVDSGNRVECDGTNIKKACESSDAHSSVCIKPTVC